MKRIQFLILVFILGVVLVSCSLPPSVLDNCDFKVVMVYETTDPDLVQYTVEIEATKTIIIFVASKNAHRVGDQLVFVDSNELIRLRAFYASHNKE